MKRSVIVFSSSSHLVCANCGLLVLACAWLLLFVGVVGVLCKYNELDIVFSFSSHLVCANCGLLVLACLCFLCVHT
jgi:hypothetical protein